MTIVVLNWNGRHLLDGCLEAVLAQEVEGGFEVIVVDNGSTDGSVDHVFERFPSVGVLEAKRNLGFAAANNAGLARVKTPFAVLLNNDTVVRPGWLAALLDAADSNDRVAAVQAKLVYADRPGLLQSTGTLLLSDGSGGDRGSGEPDEGQYEERTEVFAACAASALYRLSALKEVGHFDESFFMYYEDTDLSWRLRLAGWTVIYEPGAVVAHAHASGSADGSPFMRFHADRNRLLMLLKNAPWGFAYRSFRSLGARATGGPGATAAAAGHSRWRVLLSFLALAPGALLARARIRSKRRRKVTDAQILLWAYPRDRWDARS